MEGLAYCFRRGLVLALLFASPSLWAQTPVLSQGGVVNAADYTENVAPGMIIAIFGSDLAPATARATSIPLPAVLEGVSVEVIDGANTHRAPLFFVSASQINAQLPFGLTGPTLQVRVQNANGVSGAQTITVGASAPRLFTATMDGAGEAIAVHNTDWEVVSEQYPAVPGEALNLFLTGLGAVSPVIQAGEAGGDNGANGPLNHLVSAVRVTVDGIPADNLYFAGLAPGFAGLYQISFQMPGGLRRGLAEIAVQVGEDRSQPEVLLACGRDWQPVAAESIGAGGGTVSAGEFSLDVPAGALAETEQITVYGTTGAADLDDDRISAIHGIGGLPDTIAAPLALTLDLPGATPVAGETYIVMEEPGGGQLFLEATVSGNRVTATLPPRLGSSVAPSAAGPARRYVSESPKLEVFSVLGYHTLQTDHFHVHFPIHLLPQNAHVEIGNALELAYTRLEAMLMNLRRLPDEPIHVNLVSMPEEPPRWYIPEPWGEALHSFWTGTGVIKLNGSLLETPNQIATMKLKAAHTLLHLLQNAYDPRTRFQISSDYSTWLWMDEASATWFERAMSPDASYIPAQVLPNTAFLTKHGLEHTYRRPLPIPSRGMASAIQRHGYGASMFLEYLVGELDDPAWLAALYGYQATGGVGGSDYLATGALRELAPDLGGWWLEFCESYLVGEIYDSIRLPDEPAILDLAEPNEIRFVNPESETRTVTWMAPDLAARFYRVKLPEGVQPEYLFKVRVEGTGAAIVHRITKTDAIAEKFGVAGKQVEISEPWRLAANGEDLLIMLVSTRAVKPFDQTKPLILTLELAGPPNLQIWLMNSPRVSAAFSAGMMCEQTVDGEVVIDPCALWHLSNYSSAGEKKAQVLWHGDSFAIDARWSEQNHELQAGIACTLDWQSLALQDCTFAGSRTSEDGKAVTQFSYKVTGIPYSFPIPPRQTPLGFTWQLRGTEDQPVPQSAITDALYTYSYDGKVLSKLAGIVGEWVNISVLFAPK